MARQYAMYFSARGIALSSRPATTVPFGYGTPVKAGCYV
jgi:hypothetical protein